MLFYRQFELIGDQDAFITILCQSILPQLHHGCYYLVVKQLIKQHRDSLPPSYFKVSLTFFFKLFKSKSNYLSPSLSAGCKNTTVTMFVIIFSYSIRSYQSNFCEHKPVKAVRQGLITTWGHDNSPASHH